VRILRFLAGWRLGAASLALATLGGCGGAGEEPGRPADNSERAARLATETLLIDTHVDVPYRLRAGGDEDLSQRTEGGHFDYPRARAGGLDAPFMSIYIPAEYQETGGARELADELIDMVEGFVERWPDRFALATSTADVRENFESGRISLPMGMENGAAIETLADLEHFRDRGIRYITLTHSENNRICDSSYATEREWHGLSPFGEEVVREMNRLGIMVDISHVSDETFEQVLQITETPVIASHSSCRHFTPGWERNMSDEMIRALAANGGVIQINFGSAFLDEAQNRQSQKMYEEFGRFLEEHDLAQDSPEAAAEMERLKTVYPPLPVPLARVADHIDHVVSLVGIDHVGIGSDFDGVTALPLGLEDVSRYPALIEELLDRGYDDEDIRKILSGNILRVWGAVEAYAAGS
jgi:membrane dipeptidase